MAAETGSKVTCQDVISKCDKALDAKNKTIKLSATTIDTLKKQNGDLTTEVNDLRESGSKWYHNPIILFVFGAAAGSLAYTFLKK